MDISGLFAILADPRVLAVVSPLVVSGLKAVTSKLPSWSLPILSVVVGALASVLSGGDAALGAAAGAAGIGVREVIDQAKKAVTAPAAK